MNQLFFNTSECECFEILKMISGIGGKYYFSRSNSHVRKGTTFVFCAICFNSTGELLCLQGSQPDFGISVWKWREGEANKPRSCGQVLLLVL